MYEFAYHRPETIEQAQKVFNGADDAVFLAGGHTLLPTMKQRLLAPSDVIDLAAIGELGGVRVEENAITIGAMTCHDDVATSSKIRSMLPVLATLAAGIGDAQVRNRGTIGGSVANSDPAADYPAAVLGLGATIKTTNRSIEADNFFTGMFETALEEGELIVAVEFPVPDVAAYIKFPNPASRYATVGVLVARFGEAVRVAVTGAAPSVFRWSEAEAALVDDFSVEALGDIRPPADAMNEDLHATAEYRAHLCNVMAKRAVKEITG